MFNYKIVNNQELSNISGGGLGGDVLVGALSGAFQAGQSCIAGALKLTWFAQQGGYRRWFCSLWIEAPKNSLKKNGC